MELENHPQNFDAPYGVSGSKGALCIVTALTRQFSMTGFPLRSENHVTEERGQIKGQGKAAVQKILGERGITRVLAEEAGRTSRGGMRLMEAYLAEANTLHAAGIWDAKKVHHHSHSTAD
jgi:hypothetical protein